MGLSDFERRLERGVEGFFGRVFRSGVQPVEIGRKLLREMDDTRALSARGIEMARNVYVVVLAEEDFEQLSDMAGFLCDELVVELGAHARDHRYTLEGPLSVSIELDDHQRLGAVELESHFVPSKVTSSLVLPDHSRRALGGSTITIGRHADCEVVLSDQNASRRHCEIRPTAGGYVLVDLGSTNGTKLNGAPCHEAVLQHGDVIVIGQSSLWFEQG